MHSTFLKAIENRFIVKIRLRSNEKGVIERTCIPFDFGPSRKYKDGISRYHFHDLDSPDGSHNLSIKPDQLLEINLTDETFDPALYVKWTPNWFVKRDWGQYS